MDPKLLHAVDHRPEKEHADLALIAARDALVGMRTKAINLVRRLGISLFHPLTGRGLLMEDAETQRRTENKPPTSAATVRRAS